MILILLLLLFCNVIFSFTALSQVTRLISFQEEAQVLFFKNSTFMILKRMLSSFLLENDSE